MENLRDIDGVLSQSLKSNEINGDEAAELEMELNTLMSGLSLDSIKVSEPTVILPEVPSNNISVRRKEGDEKSNVLQMKTSA